MSEKNNKIKTIICMALVCVCVLFQTAYALDEKKTSGVLPDVVVTGQVFDEAAEPDDVFEASTSVHMQEIDTTEFQSQVTDLGDVLSGAYGVQIRKSGGLGSFSSASLRGSSSDQVAVYLDGVLLNDASGGGVDLSLIPVDQSERISIYRGAVPSQLAASGIGGAIQIRSIRPRKGWQGKVSAGGGSFGTSDLTAHIAGRTDKWHGLISGGYFKSDNNFEFLNNNGTPDNPADDRTEHRQNAEVTHQQVLGKLGADLSDTVQLSYTGQWFEKEQGIPRWNNDPTTNTRLDTRRLLNAVKFTALDVGSLGAQMTGSVNYVDKSETYDDRQGHIGLGSQYSRYTTKRGGASFWSELPAGSHTVSFHTDLHHEDYDVKNLISQATEQDCSRLAWNTVLADAISFSNGDISLFPALRYQTINDEVALENDPGSDSSEQDLLPSVGGLWKVAPRLSLKANWGKYIRYPSFFERYGDRGIFIGNSSLKPESGVNIDIGGTFSYSSPDLFISHWEAGLTFFQSDTSDLIVRTYDARGIGRSVNVSGAMTRGIECHASVDVSDWLAITAGYTFQNPENQSDITGENGKQLPGRYKHAAQIRPEVFWRDMAFFITCTIERGMYYDTVNGLPAPDKTVFDAGLSWQKNGIELRLDGKNITDESIEDFNGYPLPGQSVFASVSFSR